MTTDQSLRMLDLVSAWVRQVDTKAGFVTTLVLALNAVSTQLLVNHAIHLPTVFELFFHLGCWTAAALGVATIWPRLSKYSVLKERTHPSPVYFRDIASRLGDIEAFADHIESLPDEELRREVLNQVHINSRIAVRKTKLLRYQLVAATAAGLTFIGAVVNQVLMR